MNAEAPRVLHLLPDLAMGGGQRVLLRLLEEFAGRGREHAVAALAGGPMEDAFRATGMPLLVTGRFGRLRPFTRRFEADILHTNGTPYDRAFGQLVAASLRLPVVNTFHGMPPGRIPWPRRPGDAAPFLRNRVMHGANRLLTGLNLAEAVAVSAPVADAYRHWLGLPEERVTVIHNGLPSAAFAVPSEEGKQRLRAGLAIAGCAPVLIAVARLVEGKGHGLLLEALADLLDRRPGAVLVLVGEGPLRGAIAARAADLGIGGQLRLPGTRTDVPALLSLADVALSASAFEGFGLAVLEAMAQERPTVSFDLPSLRAFVEDGRSGILLPHGGGRSIAAAVDALLDAPDRAAAMGRAARERAAAFTVERQADALEAVYARAAARRRQRAG
jgi:glycosyltransferase involved in cell wall biosynthesis